MAANLKFNPQTRAPERQVRATPKEGLLQKVGRFLGVSPSPTTSSARPKSPNTYANKLPYSVAVQRKFDKEIVRGRGHHTAPQTEQNRVPDSLLVSFLENEFLSTKTTPTI